MVEQNDNLSYIFFCGLRVVKLELWAPKNLKVTLWLDRSRSLRYIFKEVSLTKNEEVEWSIEFL